MLFFLFKLFRFAELMQPLTDIYISAHWYTHVSDVTRTFHGKCFYLYKQNNFIWLIYLFLSILRFTSLNIIRLILIFERFSLFFCFFSFKGTLFVCHLTSLHFIKLIEKFERFSFFLYEIQVLLWNFLKEKTKKIKLNSKKQLRNFTCF